MKDGRLMIMMTMAAMVMSQAKAIVISVHDPKS
jgi:hypothetical protein